MSEARRGSVGGGWLSDDLHLSRRVGSECGLSGADDAWHLGLLLIARHDAAIRAGSALTLCWFPDSGS